MTLRGIVTRHASTLRQALRMAVAATLAMAAVEVLGLPSGFWAPLSALTVLQGQIGASFVAIRNYVVATVTGVLLGAFVVATFGRNLPVAGGAIFLIATLATAMHLPPGSTATAAAIVPVLVLSVSGDPWEYGYYRILDILIGMAAAVLVSFTLFPVRAVVQLRQGVAAAVRDSTALAAGALRDLAAGRPPATDPTAAQERTWARLQAAQALLPAARQELVGRAAQYDLLPFYLSHGERISEHAAGIAELCGAEQRPDTLAALVAPLGMVADATEAMGAALGAAIEAGVADTPLPAVAAATPSLRAAHEQLHVVGLAPLLSGDDLLWAHSLVHGVDELANEMEHMALRIEHPEHTVTPTEGARMAGARLLGRPGATTATPSPDPSPAGTREGGAR